MTGTADMLQCSRCGTENRPTSMFCTKCGMGLALVFVGDDRDLRDVAVERLFLGMMLGGSVGALMGYLIFRGLLWLAMTTPGDPMKVLLPVSFTLSLGVPVLYVGGCLLGGSVAGRRQGFPVSRSGLAIAGGWALGLSALCNLGSTAVAVFVLLVGTPLLAARFGIGFMAPWFPAAKLAGYSLVPLIVAGISGLATVTTPGIGP